ncbi:hypothetical protein GGQ88_003822 [Novosphingobium hassiacum]|uniref:Uncharacterized protein n=1 Tax=Novosphingobium hassiacum TaxID=173676 RepID=A0A7W5ZYT3_9SPHN|nr:hypothetical protein [Novosphingobium hassiacum]MBB3862521.1 hypothetical protein [Novosphingobium hassiacum]
MMSDVTQTSIRLGAAQGAKPHFVHVYTVIRIKVAVDAAGHRAAMEAADAVLFGDRHAVRLNPAHPAVIDADFVEEVTEYLVDEAADPTFALSRSYGPDYAPRRACDERRAA